MYALSGKQLNRARLELGLIKQAMGAHLEMTAEIQPIFDNANRLLFLLGPNEFLWLAADGSAMRDRVHGASHQIDTFRDGQVVAVMDAEKR